MFPYASAGISRSGSSVFIVVEPAVSQGARAVAEGHESWFHHWSAFSDSDFNDMGVLLWMFSRSDCTSHINLPQHLLLSLLQALKALFTSRSTGIGRKGRWLTAEDLEAYLYALSQPGALTGALNYYRNVFRWGILKIFNDIVILVIYKI